MNWKREQEIRDAIRHQDAQALNEAISNLSSWDRDFDEVEEVVRDAGGSRYCHFGRIELDDPSDGYTEIHNHFGHAESEHHPRY